MKLKQEFYLDRNVVKIAKNLLGKGLFTRVNGVVTGGMIVETEAYSWKEKGCHAYNSKKTTRNEIMFAEGGHAYVYLCYGIHNLFNVVTNDVDTAEAVLIRALEPIVGVDEMMIRRNNPTNKYLLTSGPGKLTRALGIDRTFDKKSLLEDDVWLEDIGKNFKPSEIVASPRIGIDYAGQDALLPWRFSVRGNRWVSR